MTSTNTDTPTTRVDTRIASVRHPELDHCPFMPVFGAPKLMIERGRGTEVWDTDGKRYLDFLSGIAVVSLGHANPVVAAAIAEQARHLAARQQLLRQPAGDVGGDQDQRAAARRLRPRRPDLLHQLRRRVERVRHQAGPQVGRARPPLRRQRARQLPRAHAGDAGGDRPAEQARAVPADAGGLQARRLGRSRRDARRGRRIGGGGADRAVAGRGRRQPGTARLSRGDPAAVRRDRGADDGRRDPDRVRPHRTVVRVRAHGRRARRRHARQGDGQRDAGRRVLGRAATSPRCSSPATTAARTAAPRSRPPPWWP